MGRSAKYTLKSWSDLFDRDLIKEWDVDKNIGMDPEKIAFCSPIKVWWKCKCGHEWQSSISTRANKGAGCPYCSRRYATPGVNSLQVEHPDIAKEWHPSKNKVTADEVLSGSNKKVWWLGKCGHEWEAVINNRVNQHQGCPYCANNRVLSGFNDLQTKNPELADEWHPTKNGNLRPLDVTSGSNVKVWWLGKCGHEWQSAVTDRKINGCPICSNRKFMEGFNDYLTVEPELSKEWHPTKNGPLSPKNTFVLYNRPIWWKGECGHEWKESPRYRHYYKTGCPTCFRESKSSFNEKAIFFYLKKSIPDAISCYRPDYMFGKEFDIFIPSLKVAIEYDGNAFHNNLERDLEKVRLAEGNGIFLIRIREPKCPKLPESVCYHTLSTSKELAIVEGLQFISKIILNMFKIEVAIPNDVSHDRGAIYDLMMTSKKEHSLAVIKPHLAKLWHPTKNGSLSPDMIGFASDRKVWWKGPCGHEWEAAPDFLDDTSKCPFCYGTRVLSGFNDLKTLHPDLVNEWNFERNRTLRPSDVTEKSNRYVWWICEKGHEWEAEVVRRVQNKARCPYCTNQKLLLGYNDFATKHPQIAAEWHPTLNGYLQPWEIIDGSKLDVWWMCSKGHEWKVSINQRTNMKSGCPICSVRKAGSAGTIAEERPELLKQWHPSKNKGLDPNKMTIGSHTPVWWICEKGHEWQASPHGRRSGRGCPICAGKVVLKGFNDLGSQSPDVAKQWHPTLNGDITPDMVMKGSKKKYWWICEKGHEWQAVVATRTRWGCGCPFCVKASRKYTLDKND